MKCPNLREICLTDLPRDRMITLAVSELVLNINKNTLHSFEVDYPLTKEACEVIYQLPDLCTLYAAIDVPTALPTVVLPNLNNLDVDYFDGYHWLQSLRGASVEKLDSIAVSAESDSIDGFLEEFKTVALTTSIPATLSTFRFYTGHPWRPNYRPLLPFTQLQCLTIGFSCELGCSSTIDDDTITDLARAMPRLETLELGNKP
jgi:hypothetical protein